MALSIQELSERFEANLPSRIAAMRESFEAIPAATEATEAITAMRRLVHDLQGQAATFSYPLIGEFAESVTMILRGISTIPEDRHEVVLMLIDAMGVVADNKVRGTGGAIGDALRKNIKEIVGTIAGPAR